MSVGKYPLIVILALVLPDVVCAQDSTNYSTLSLHTGLSRIANKDEFQSPYTYRGIGLLANFSYSNVRARGQHVLEFIYSGGRTRSIVSPQANNILVRFGYDYLRDLKPKTKDQKFVALLGPGLHTLLNNTNYLPAIETPKSYFSGSVFLTLSGNILYHLNKKNSVSLRSAFPLFGVVHRPDFEINGKTLTKAMLIGKANLFSAVLEYNYQMTTSLHVTGAVNYSYFSYVEPRPIAILQNSFLVGLRKKF
jgi:hypothetical protein